MKIVSPSKYTKLAARANGVGKGSAKLLIGGFLVVNLTVCSLIVKKDQARDAFFARENALAPHSQLQEVPVEDVFHLLLSR